MKFLASPHRRIPDATSFTARPVRVWAALALCLMSAPALACKVALPEGARDYQGECRNGLAHGAGRATVASPADPNGQYKGSFVDGKLHGEARYVSSRDNSESLAFFDMGVATKEVRAKKLEADTANWRKAQATNTLAGNRDYIRQNPGSHFLKEAFAALYAKVKAANSAAAYSDFIEEFPDAPEAEQAKAAGLKLSGLESRHSFREGKIGERYVPSYSESRYSTQTYTVNGKAYTESRRTGEDTYGGHSEGRHGYTAVYQLFNESRLPYVVRVRISGSSIMTEQFVKTSFWLGNKSLATRTSTNQISREMHYLLDAGEDVKDQIVVGESKPSDFTLEFIDIVPVSAAWMAGLRKALDGQGDLKSIEGYLADPKAAGWHANLRERFSELAGKQINVQLATGKRFDPDFDSPVEVSFTNRSNMALKVNYKPNFGGTDTLSLPAGQSKTVTVSARGVAKDRLAVALQTVESLNGTQASGAGGSSDYAAGVEKRRLATAEILAEEQRITEARAAEERRIVEERAAEELRIEQARTPEERRIAFEQLKRDLVGGVFRDCPSCPEMVLIPSGSFQMGANDGERNEKPVHVVQVASFSMGKTEVTQGQWRTVMGSNPSKFSDCGDDCPVEWVSWDDAQEYIRKLNAQTGKRYRLPNEAEWEYACRAGGNHTYCGSNDVGAVAWYDKNSGKRPRPVAGKQANAFGLHDMSGNVWEWVQDCWHDSHHGAPTDGSTWTSGCKGDGRVLRSGSWENLAWYSRAAIRNLYSSGSRYHIYGFRLARTH